MLDRRADVLRLDATNGCCTDLTGKIGILGIIFEVSSAEGTSVNINGRRQPDADIILLHLSCRCATDFFCKFRIPGAGHHGRAREGRGIHTTLWIDAKACRAICGHHIGNAILPLVTDTEGIRHTGIGLATQHGELILQGESRDEVLHGHPSLCHIQEGRILILRLTEGAARTHISCLRQDRLQLSRILSGKIRIRENLMCCSVTLHPVIMSIRSQALRKANRIRFGRQLLYDGIFVNVELLRDLPAISYIRSYIEAVSTCLKYPGRLSNSSLIIVRCHLCKGQHEVEFLHFSRRKFSCLTEGNQLSCRLIHLLMRCFDIELYYFFSGTFSGVLYSCMENKLISATSICFLLDLIFFHETALEVIFTVILLQS